MRVAECLSLIVPFSNGDNAVEFQVPQPIWSMPSAGIQWRDWRAVLDREDAEQSDECADGGADQHVARVVQA